jgi:DNA polymerase III sliding clamp (beta) subunit (PCNA family)
MKFETNARPFLSALRALKAIAPNHATLPALECVRLEVLPDGSSVRLSATNLEMSGRLSLDSADIGNLEPGACAVRLRTLLDSLKGAKGTLAVALDGNVLRVHSKGAASVNLPVVPLDELPDVLDMAGRLAPLDSVDVLNLETDTLRSCLETVASATARKPGRYAMQGVQIVTGKGTVGASFAGTDNQRLHFRTLSILGHPAPDSEFILPRDGAQWLVKYLPKAGAVRVSVVNGGATLRAVAGGVDFACRIMDGEFPRLAPLLESVRTPAHSIPSRAVLDIDATLSALKSIRGTIGRTDAPCVRLAILDTGAVRLEASANGAETRIELEDHAGYCTRGREPLVGLNPQYLTEALEAHKARGAERATLEWCRVCCPTIVTAEPGDLETLVMPITLAS